MPLENKMRMNVRHEVGIPLATLLMASSLVFNPQQAFAIPPPEIISSVGSQIPHLFYLLVFFLSSALGIIARVFSDRRKKLFLMAAVLVLGLLSLVVVYFPNGFTL